MKIIKEQINSAMKIKITGELDNDTAPELVREVVEELDGITDLEFDMEELDYISSAGLRAVLKCQQIMDDNGKMVLKNVKPEIMTMFRITGFLEILTIEEA